MNDRDPFELLTRTVPFTPEAGDPVEHPPADMALFEEIIMHGTSDAARRAARRASTPRPVWRRPAPILAAAAAAALVVAGTIVADDAPSAYAQVVQAAETLAETPSGVVQVEVDLRRITSDGGVAESGRVSIDSGYTDTAFAMRAEFAVGPVGSAPPEPLVIELRRVDGTDYTFAGGRWVSTPASDDALADPLGLGVGAADADPDRIVALVEAASDVERVATGDGVTTYTATVTAAALEALDEQPAGIALIASQPGNMPESVGLTVEVADGLLRTIRLDAVGEYPGTDGIGGGEVDASITATFSQPEQPIEIKAPPASEVTPQDAVLAEMARNARIVDEYLTAHPESTCLSDTSDEPVDMAAFTEQVAQCFEAEGVPDIAEAWRAMNAGID